MHSGNKSHWISMRETIILIKMMPFQQKSNKCLVVHVIPKRGWHFSLNKYV